MTSMQNLPQKILLYHFFKKNSDISLFPGCSIDMKQKDLNMDIDVEDYYRRYGPMVLRRCRSLLNDEEKALDAMQDVFVRLIQNRHKLKGDYPSSLLYRIATNICLNIIRAEKSRPVTGDSSILETIADYTDMENRVILRDYIDRIFKGHPESTREMAVMHYVDHMTLQQVADETGFSVSGVRKRLRKLKEELQCREVIE